jgi:hypothetical protein
MVVKPANKSQEDDPSQRPQHREHREEENGADLGGEGQGGGGDRATWAPGDVKGGGDFFLRHDRSLVIFGFG